MGKPYEGETARIRMLEVRKTLEDYERLHGTSASSEYTILKRAFDKAIDDYLKSATRSSPQPTQI